IQEAQEQVQVKDQEKKSEGAVVISHEAKKEVEQTPIPIKEVSQSEVLETQRAFVKLLTIKGMIVDMAQIKKLSHPNQLAIFKMMLNQGYSIRDVGGIAKLSTDIHLEAMKILTGAGYSIAYDQIRALTTPQQVNMLRAMVKEGYKKLGQDKKILNTTGLASLDATGKIGDLYQSVMEAITRAGKNINYEQIKALSNENQVAMLKMMLDHGYGEKELNFSGLETLSSDVHKDAMKVLTDAGYQINFDQIALLKNQNQVAILKSFIKNNYNNGEKGKLNFKFISENNLSTDVHQAAVETYVLASKSIYSDIISRFKNMNQVEVLKMLIKNNYFHSNEAAKNALTWIAALSDVTTSQVDAIREMSASGKALPSTEAIKLF
ncbi:MAG: hypothetical protein HQK51_11340, partial [Oligoflexia bacterium]|nr:hypothetical protein [Oligoflexia bacterium]